MQSAVKITGGDTANLAIAAPIIDLEGSGFKIEIHHPFKAQAAFGGVFGILLCIKSPGAIMKLKLKVEDDCRSFKLFTPEGEEITGIDHIDLRTTESGHHQAVVYFYIDAGSLNLSDVPCLFPIADD